MEVLSYVKDLLLYYANKKAELKTNSESKDKYEALDKEFVSNMLVLRDRFPEYLFVNYDKNITEEEAKEVFKRIKANVSNRYSIPYLPKPQFMPIDIDGTKMEIPGLLPTVQKEKGVFVISYLKKEEKRKCTNQFLLHLLMQLPIKKTTLTFVDLKGEYDYELFIQNLPTSIYNDSPITKEKELEELIDRLEKRKYDVISKYGDYSISCEQNKQISLPYEVIVFYDDLTKEYDQETKWSGNIDEEIQLIETKTPLLEFYENSIFKRLKKLVEYADRIGVYFVFLNYLDSNNIISTNADREVLNEEQGIIDLDNNTILYTNPSKKTRNAEYGRTGLYYVEDTDISWQMIHGIGYSIDKVGSGDFEIIGGDGDFVRAYSTIEECKKRKEEMHDLFPAKNLTPTIALQYYEKESGFWKSKYAIELVVETNKTNIILDYFYDDLIFYLTELEIPIDFQQRMIGIMKEEIIPSSITELKNGDTLHFRYWNEVSKDEVQIIKDGILVNISNKVKKKWGKDSCLHLCIDSALDDHAIEFVIKRNHIRVPIEHYDIPKNDGIINFTPITSNETLLKACFDYIRTEAEAKEEMKVQTLDFDSAAASKYETDLSTMIIPVGKAESKDANFRMDLVSHVHSFIIGQSGSGKSVFLHNIIGGAMLKYAPEDLQLYLLDFKLGGVEFNRYQGAKHVKALLVDNSDPQVTLEILRELRGSMTERGKLLRGAGVNNIGEYNKLHQQDRMPHVLVVADECHEMFKADDSIPRQVRNEISDIVIKIAKEGRSQGVHLVFATQTLSGTEISSEIINNVSDFYLLKCAQTDSERLVPNSSAITSELSTGQIYYHHVDEQVKFQAYYTDKEAAEKLMAAIVEKAKDHKSNGEFYFNGAQMFYLDESVKEQMLAVKGKSPLAFMGKAIDISQKDLYIKLNEDFSENVLLLGLNDQEQVTRTTMNLFVSLMMSAKLKHEDIAFKVIDCLNNEEGEVHELIFDMENEGYCDIIERRQRSKFFKELAQSVLDGTAEETILLILGQDRFRELKMDMPLEDGGSNASDDENMNILSDDLFSDSSSSSTSVRTYRDALNVILEKGPDYGVHTLLQIEKASNLLFEDYITPKVVFQKFKHLVMLRSDETAGVTLHLNDDIRLEKLSSDWERLRAYYYAEESDSYTLFTPYMPSKSKDIINLLKTI